MLQSKQKNIYSVFANTKYVVVAPAEGSLIDQGRVECILIPHDLTKNKHTPTPWFTILLVLVKSRVNQKLC